MPILTNAIKAENKHKLEGASNYRVWKKRIDLILENNKVLDLVKGKVKKPIDDSSDANKVKFKELELMAMTLMVEGIKDNLVPLIANINHAQEKYEALSKLFTIKNIGQMASLKNELRTPKMTKEDAMASFVKIARIRDELLAIDEIVLDKELMITVLLGLPPTWGAFAAGLNSWKEAPTFEEVWTTCSEEQLRLSLVANSKDVSNAYIAQHKGKRSKGPRKKIDMSKVECCQCHKKGHYKSHCPDNPRNKGEKKIKPMLLKRKT